MAELSANALRVLQAMAANPDAPPSIRTLVEQLGFSSPRLVHFHLQRLGAKGYTERSTEAGRQRKRAWRITEAGIERAREGST